MVSRKLSGTCPLHFAVPPQKDPVYILDPLVGSTPFHVGPLGRPNRVECKNAQLRVVWLGGRRLEATKVMLNQKK